MPTAMIEPTELDDIIAQIELGDDFSDFEGDNQSYVVAGEVSVVEANTWHTLRETISLGGVESQTNLRVRFKNPILSSIAQRKTDAVNRPNRVDFNGTVVSHRELEIQGKDGGWIPIDVAVCAALRRGNTKLDMTDTDILLQLRSYGFDQSGRLPMYLQHLGANLDAFNECAAKFVKMGAKDNQADVAKRSQGKRSAVQKSFRHPEGIRIGSLDISHVDRSMSTTNTGFIGWSDGLWNTLRHIIIFDKERSAIKKVSPEAEEYAAMQEREAEIGRIFRTAASLRAFRNWGGTTKVVNVDVLTEKVETVYYAQQVPCGRLSVESGYGLEGYETYSVWGTKETNETALATADATVAAQAETAEPDTTDEAPY